MWNHVCWGCDIYFFQIILSYGKSYRCKGNFFYSISSSFSFTTIFFAMHFCLNSHIFFHSCPWRLFLYIIRTCNSLFNSIYLFPWLIHQWFSEQILLTSKVMISCCAIVHTYLIFVDFLSQHFIKILIPLYGKFFLLKSLLFQCFHVSWLQKKVTIFPPKKPIAFAKTKLSISDEKSYLGRSKQSREFHRRNGHFLCLNTNSLNLSGS